MKGIAIFMASVITAGSVGFLAYESEGFKNWNTDTWFGKKSIEQTQTEPDKTSEIKDNSLVVTPDANMSVRKLERSVYTANCISEDTYGAYTLSVIVEPFIASVKTATWSVAWQDPESTWASDKAVSDYVTLSVVQGVSTTISCNEQFAEQIIVTAISDGNTDLSATCTVDFRKRAENFKIYENAGGMGYVIPEVYTVDYGNAYSFLGSHSYGIGTVSPNPVLEGKGIKISLSDEFIAALLSFTGVLLVSYSPPTEAFYNPTTKLYDITCNSAFINSLVKVKFNDTLTPIEICSDPGFWECVQSVEKHIVLTYSYSYNGQVEGSCVRYLKLNVPATGISMNETSIVF